MFKCQVSSFKFQHTNNMNQKFIISNSVFKCQVSSFKFQLTNNMNQDTIDLRLSVLSIKYQASSFNLQIIWIKRYRSQTQCLVLRCRTSQGYKGNYNSKRNKNKDIMNNKEEPSLLKIIYRLIEVTWQFSLQQRKLKQMIKITYTL